MKRFGTAIACLGLVALLAGCSTTRVAQEKSVTVGQVKLAFGGSFVTGQNDLTITVNGDPLMRGTFPPYTPTLNMNGEYQGLQVNASCYFGSVLGSKRGIVGIVAGSVQGAVGNAGDKCDMSVNDQKVETLYF